MSPSVVAGRNTVGVLVGGAGPSPIGCEALP